MSQPNLADNPFAALFSSVDQAQQFSATFKPPQAEQLGSGEKEGVKSDKDIVPDLKDLVSEKITINKLIEDIFLLTIDPDTTSDHGGRLVYLEDLHTSLKGQVWLDVDCLEQAVFDRLMLAEPEHHLLRTNDSSSSLHGAPEADPLRYLFSSYQRAHHHKHKCNHKSAIEKCVHVILLNTKLCLLQPEVFALDSAASQFISIFEQEASTGACDLMEEYFGCAAVLIDETKEDGTVIDAFRPVFHLLHKQLRTELSSLSSPLLFNYVQMVHFFSRKACLAESLLDYTSPAVGSNGRLYEDSLLGTLLSFSCIVKNEAAGPYEFFDEPSRASKQDHDLTESRIHQPLGVLNERIYQILRGILKHGGQTRHRLLDWLGMCLQANKGRAKLWTNQMMPNMFQQMYCSDGFFLNLCAVLLRLCQPFSSARSPRLLKIQPTYCLATIGSHHQLHNRNVHFKDMDETGLVPPPDGENEQPQPDSEYNFMSECFFLTHYCLHLGFHVVHEKFLKLNQDLHRTQQVYQDIVRQGGQNTDPGQRIKEQMEKGMSIFLCLKAALTEPQLLDLLFDFHVATTTYLVHLATTNDHSAFKDVTFPLPEYVPPELTCIPEFVAENVLDYMMFLRRFKDTMFETAGDQLSHLMTFILVFMGSPEHMRNPHLRAHLAESLEAIMPPQQDQRRTMVSHYQREQLFRCHPQIEHLAHTLLHVFVSIEMTGQGVEFEQKFNYRRPMYSILEYIWSMELHRNAIQDLAVHAEAHIEDTNAPLFLRFINLLINDAIFLLDEALSYMVQIKEKQEERDRGDWNNLAARQRQETEANYRHLTMLAKFHNIMGSDTIHSLELITQEIKSIFMHNIMVDRIAAMLNYLLLHLVGPKKKTLKVKDFAEVEFKPQEVVSHISDIYLHLGAEERFRSAVARDGRSYSHGLFEQAAAVLQRIHRPQPDISRFIELGQQIKMVAAQQEDNEELIADAPEEFLDPIMGSLMRDPVTLPSSGKIVDRSTIARHILSDQNDPFNRQPLAMDMVVPNTELKERIKQWLTEHQAK